MQFLSLTWSVLKNLATGAVILAMFHIAKSPFETIVISALVLIYVVVIGTFMSQGYALSKKWNIDQARYIAIAAKLGLNIEIEEEAHKENREQDEKGQTAFWITVVFNMLFGFIAIAYLVYTITSQVT